MSWFKRRPRVKEPPKQPPKSTSPLSEKVLKESKAKMRKKTDD